MQNERKSIKDGENKDLAAERKTGRFHPGFRAALFLLILCLLGVYLLHVFDMKDDKGAEKSFNAFYDEKENSLDGIYIGSSSAYRFWIPPYAYEYTGMAISNLGTGSQPVVLQKYIIEEALKTQPDMKVVIIDIRSMLNDDKRLKEADIRRVTDSFHVFDSFFRLSRNRTGAIDASLEYFRSQDADIDYTRKYYYFSFLKYHNRWQSDITLRDLTGLDFKNRFKGFVFTSTGSLSVKILKEPSYTDKKADEIKESKRRVLEDLLDYCSSLDQKVIFVSSPYRIPADEQEQLNACADLIGEAGFTFLNFNQKEQMEELELDWSSDFMDRKHVNVYGAMKYTDYLMEYLDEELNLEDHREESGYQSWRKSVRRFNRKLERLEELKEDGMLQLNSDE